MDYLIVVEARCYAPRPGVLATESAFASHLRMLRQRLGPRFERMVVAAPSYRADFYEANRHHLGEVTEAEDGIVFLPLSQDGGAPRDYWLKDARRILPALWRATRGASIVHSGLSQDLFRPSAFLAIVFGVLLRRKTLFFIDIDFRDKARMHYQNGTWSRKTYLVCRYLLDPLRRLQVWLAVRCCSLCLLKSARMVADYGRGRPNVRNFFDTVHSPDHILSAPQLGVRIARLSDPKLPLRIVYFGRFVPYKGLDLLIRAVHLARTRCGRPLELLLLGSGKTRPLLESVIHELGAGEWVELRDAVPFGPELFEILSTCSMHVATPLVEDTPRAAFDAMAAGLPILAFDIAYYRDLRATGAVETSPWPDPQALAERICELDADRSRLVSMAIRGVETARENTQEIWLDRRIRWTLELLDGC